MNLFLLREKLSDEILVRKVLRSFPKRFNMKVTANEEANDISKMKLDELFGSLHTFKLSLDENVGLEGKGLALHSLLKVLKTAKIKKLMMV